MEPLADFIFSVRFGAGFLSGIIFACCIFAFDFWYTTLRDEDPDL